MVLPSSAFCIQYMSEKVLKAQGTVIDDDFRALEKVRVTLLLGVPNSISQFVSTYLHDLGYVSSLMVKSILPTFGQVCFACTMMCSICGDQTGHES